MKEEERVQYLKRLKKIIEDLDKYSDVLTEGELKPYKDKMDDILKILTLPDKSSTPSPSPEESMEETHPKKPSKATKVQVGIDYEELKNRIDKILKQKIDEERIPFNMFIYYFIHNPNKLEFRKIIELWDDIEYVNYALKNLIPPIRSRKLKTKLSNLSRQLYRSIGNANMRASIIKNYKKHSEESKSRAEKHFKLSPSSGRFLYDLEPGQIDEYMNTRHPRNGFKRGLERLNRRRKPDKDIYNKNYNFRKRMFEYWKKIFDIYYKEIRDDISRIKKVLREIHYVLLKEHISGTAKEVTLPVGGAEEINE